MSKQLISVREVSHWRLPFASPRGGWEGASPSLLFGAGRPMVQSWLNNGSTRAEQPQVQGASLIPSGEGGAHL